MRIKYFCSWWGLDHLGLESMLKKIKTAGFDGVEIGIPFNEKDKDYLKYLLKKYGLDIIAHQYQASGNFNEYKFSFKNSLENAAQFNPIFINSHTGRDFWTTEQNLEILDIAKRIESKYGISIIHETHRKHFLFSTLTANIFFKLEKELKITADFSHWTCVSETLLEDQQEITNEAISRSEHIHARIGYEQGPQISDPRAVEWEFHLITFTNWWEKILNRFKNESREYLTITPEFGPIPYTWKLPYSYSPISNFFEINCWMKDYLKEKFK